MTDKDKSLEEQSEEQKKTVDPQENEKDGNVFGGAFDAVFGNAEGGNSLDEDDADDPGKQGSIKE